MTRENVIPNMEAYFAKTSIGHLQKVFDDIKDFENIGPDVKEYLSGLTGLEHLCANTTECDIKLKKETDIAMPLFM